MSATEARAPGVAAPRAPWWLFPAARAAGQVLSRNFLLFLLYLLVFLPWIQGYSRLLWIPERMRPIVSVLAVSVASIAYFVADGWARERGLERRRCRAVALRWCALGLAGILAHLFLDLRYTVVLEDAPPAGEVRAAGAGPPPQPLKLLLAPWTPACVERRLEAESRERGCEYTLHDVARDDPEWLKDTLAESAPGGLFLATALFLAAYVLIVTAFAVGISLSKSSAGRAGDDGDDGVEDEDGVGAAGLAASIARRFAVEAVTADTARTAEVGRKQSGRRRRR